MSNKIPASFKIFIIVVSITALVFTTATLFSYYHVNKKFAMLLAFCMFIALAFTTVGIYTGFRYKAEDERSKILNRIGLIGNLIIFLFTMGMMALAVISLII